MADCDRTPVVFLFARVEEVAGGSEEAGALARDAAGVLLEAIRGFRRGIAVEFASCSGGSGAETLVLSPTR